MHAVLAMQMPLCYHPSIEYNLTELNARTTSHAVASDVLFPGIVKTKPRREEILTALAASGISTRVSCIDLARVLGGT